MANIRNTFHAEMVEYMVGEADSFGYEVVLGAVTPTHGESAVVETLLDFRCEALILLGPEFDDSELPTLAARAPVVVVGRRTSCPAVDVVRTADARGIGSIVDHLVALGHRRITHLSGGSGSISADRKAGYIRAMKRHGLSAEIEIIDGDFTEGAGITAARRCWRERNGPPRCAPPTTAAPSASLTNCAAPAWTFPATLPSLATTTASSPNSPTSTSPPPANNPTNKPRKLSKPSSNVSTTTGQNGATSCSNQSSLCAAPPQLQRQP